jgi:hypothetical protein
MPTKLVNREEFLLDYCKGKNVVHLGCCDSPYCYERYSKGDLFHIKLIESARKVIGVDSDEQSIIFMKKAGINNLIVDNVENFSENYPDNFHIILAGEIIEHLESPGLFLKNINKLAHNGTELIITTINTPTLKSFIRALAKTEIVHHDHVCYYSLKTLSHLLNRYNILITKYYYYCASPVSESGLMMGLFNKVSKGICNFFPTLADGLIAICNFKDNN